MTTAIKLPDMPREYLYEDYIAAHILASGLFIERSVEDIDIDQILELDIVVSDFTDSKLYKMLVEVKSGNWGYPDLFKVKGWMSFLNINTGAMVVQKGTKNGDVCNKISKELDIRYIQDVDASNTIDSLSPVIKTIPEYNHIIWVRYAFAMERAMLIRNRELKKSNPNMQSYKHLENFYNAIVSRSFFNSDPLERVRKLFSSYLTYKNITAKMSYELRHKIYDHNILEIESVEFNNIFYQAKNSPLHLALHTEHMARIMIMKSCVEYLVEYKDSSRHLTFVDKIRLMALPSNIKNGLKCISEEPFFYLYPVFWQIFTYLFGGVIMSGYKAKDYEILSKLSGIPIDHIDNAFNAFNVLFPKGSNGWFVELPGSDMIWHNLFSVPFSGIGVNFRRCEYVDPMVFSNLNTIKPNTIKDILKWNKLAHEIMSNIKDLEVTEIN